MQKLSEKKNARFFSAFGFFTPLLKEGYAPLHSSFTDVDQLPICLKDISMLRVRYRQEPSFKNGESVDDDPQEAGG